MGPRSKIFIGPGYSYVRQIEIIDMPSDTSPATCSIPPDYPIDVDGTVSAIVNDTITICGPTNKCYSYNKKSNTWQTFPHMLTNREGACSTITAQNIWWVNGGEEGASSLDTSEIYNVIFPVNGKKVPNYRRRFTFTAVSNSMPVIQ